MRTRIKQILTTIFFLTLYLPLVAQTENPFLERDFWRDKPSVEIIQQKIEEGHSLIETDHHGRDAFDNALSNTKDIEVIKLLVKKGANVLKKYPRYGRTTAFLAVRSGNLEILKYLVSKGVDPNSKDKSGNSLIMYAASSGMSNANIYNYLLDQGNVLKNSTDEYGRNALLLYARRIKNIEMVDYFLKKGLSIHNTDKEGNGVFNYAASSKNKKILEELIKRGASPKANPKTGENAFTFATRGRGGALTIVFLKYLESLELDPTALTKEGSTCLNNISFSEKKPEIFKYFIDKGIDPNTGDKNGNTPFIRASYRNSKEVIEYLLSFTNDINVKNNDGSTALSNAIRRNTAEVVDFLIAKGAYVTIKDKKGNDLGAQLVDSYRSSDMKIFHKKMELLTEQGYRPQKAAVQNGNSLLQVAIRNGNVTLVKEVIGMQIPINYKNDEGYTPLHVAVMTAKNDNVMKTLLAEGADKSIKTEFGESVYELAIENETLRNKKVNLNFLR